MTVEILGYMAATLTTVAFVPQVIQVWKTRSAKDISFPMYALFTTGIGLWSAYGFMIDSWPVIGANVVTFVLALSVLIMKWRFDKNTPAS